MKPLVILLAAVVMFIPSHAGAGDSVRRGDSGPVVTEVQTILSGFSYTVKIDGQFGKQTERAVLAWQKSNGLTPDGIAGPLTLASLRSATRLSNAQQVTPTVPPPPPEYVPEHGWAIWDAIARCESGGNPTINTGNGYYGLYQFALSSWRAVGGTGYPHQHSRVEQTRRAEMLQDIQGFGAWPTCRHRAGV